MRSRRRTMRILTAAVLVGIVCLAETTAAQCPPGTKSLRSHWIETTKPQLDHPGELRDFLLQDTPTFSPRDQQDSSPSANGSDATIVNAAKFTNLLSAAFDQTGGNNDGDDTQGFTLNVNPFLLAVAMDSSAYYDQKEYMKDPYVWMRRIGGSVTFGGKGEAFDRDGDGNVDEALESEALDDIVTWEFRARLLGSRDRRENADWIFDQANTTTLEEVEEQTLKAVAALQNDFVPGTDCVPEAKLGKVPVAFMEANQAYINALKQLDRELLVTVAITGVERKHDFGSDKHGVGLRASWMGFDANADWMHMSGLTDDAEDMDQFKLGLTYAIQLLKGWELDGLRLTRDADSKGWLKNGIDASISAALEIYDDTPDVSHDTNVKIQGKLEIPVTEGVRFPLSVTWANHEDLLDKDDKIMGHFGINVDTSKLADLAKNWL